MQLIIRHANGRSYMQAIEAGDTVSQLIALVCQRDGLQQPEVRLAFKGKQLANEKTIEESGLSEEDMVMVEFVQAQAQMYNMASAIIADRLNEEEGQVLNAMEKTDVIVVRGNSDKIESVLAAIGVPHTVIEPTTLNTYKLSSEQTVYINCHPSYPQGSAENIAAFVHAGGQLITTDHVLTHLVQQAFPNTIRHSGGSTSDFVVEIEINKEEVADGVLQGFANEKTWWLAGGSHPVSVVNESAVTVLIKAVDGSPILVRFKHGDGTVYHMTSHFHLQQGQKPAPVGRTAPSVLPNRRGGNVEQVQERSRSRSPVASSSRSRFSNPFANMSNPFKRNSAPDAAVRRDAEQNEREMAMGDDVSPIEQQQRVVAESKEEEEVGYDSWAMSKGATPQTLERLQATKESQEREEGGSAINYRNLQNAACASEFVVRSVLQQKKKTNRK